MSKLMFHRCLIMVTSKCQLRCKGCVTKEVRAMMPDYSMDIDQLEAFIKATVDSGYHYEDAWFNGLGDPMLWDYIVEGAKIVKESGISDNVYVATNQIAKEPEGIRKYATIMPGGSANIQFKILPDNATGDIPCKCRCGGPMVIGDLVYPFCGPPIFGTGRDPVFVPVDKDYMDNAPKSGHDKRELEACKTCWGNMNITLVDTKKGEQDCS